METNGRPKSRLASLAVATLVALAIVPVLASSASAASVGTGASPVHGDSSSWAYGGEATGTFGESVGHIHYALDATAGLDVIYNETNTSANTTELTANRTVVVTVSETYSGPVASWTYQFKLAEDDLATANLTNRANVTDQTGAVVGALGLLNASLHADVTVAASLVGTAANHSLSDYLNASGSASAHVTMTPALGLIPLNLTNITGWTASASAAGNATWDLGWSWVDHGWNGTSESRHGTIAGNWSATTEVMLVGHVGHPYGGWNDHRPRTAVGLTLSGPFDLYAGVLLVPRSFDLFGGAAHDLGMTGLSSTAGAQEYVFLNAGARVDARSMTAGNFTTGAPAPYGAAVAVSADAAPAAAPDPGATVWAQPMSTSAARSQASCLQYGRGCAAVPASLGGLFVAFAIAGAAAVVAVALVVGRRGRGGRPTRSTADVPLGARAPPTPMPPTPPTGVVPLNGPVSPFA